MLVSNSETQRQVLKPSVKADLRLADRDESYWSAHVSKSLVACAMRRCLNRNCRVLPRFPCRDLRYRQLKVWREADALSPREVNRKAVICHHWCG
eukprot:624050-Pelagomonas_calceolata.AAC.1